MSRDAKVGLVIIFSFVFLLGTIFLHRFYFSADESTGAFNAPVVSESESETTSANSGQRYQMGDETVPSSAVDAVPAENLTQPDPTQRPDLGFGDSQKTRRTPNLARPPVDLPASQSNGSLISLTEGETYQPATAQQRAAVVEPNNATQSQTQRGAGNAGTSTADVADNATRRNSPLLEIRTPGREPDQDEPLVLREQQSTNPFAPKTAAANKAFASSNHEEGSRAAKSSPAHEAPAESNTESNDRPGANPVEEEAVESRTADKGHDADETVAASSDDQSNDNVMARSSTGRSQRAPFELDDSNPIQQTEGKRQVARELDTPPSLPKYGEFPQATIESVPARSGRPDLSATAPPSGLPNRSTFSNRNSVEESAGADDESSAGQRTYVVKEGDSFWTISAKQYGTGKYFRALEEFNRHRLAAYENGVRILRPGTEILLPTVAVLRSKTQPPKSNTSTTGTAVAENDTFKPRQGLQGRHEPDLQDTLPRPSTGGTDRSATSRVYRVKEGDSLSKIAQRELGASKRWQEIYELNARELAGQDVLKIGMELKLPGDRPVEKLVDRPLDGR